MRTTLTTEGSTTIEVPLLDEDADYPPSSAEVFFNPSQRVSRDITVAAMHVLGEGMSYLDALAATGIRGLRLANEVEGLEVTLCDWNRRAVELMRRNARRVGREVEVVHADATVLMRERSFDVVDIDPFGSPAPFLDCAAKCARRFLWITATDKAPLCGAHPKAALRKYAAHPLNTEYHAEVGLRTLLYAVACALARYQKGMTPLLSFSTMHYYRTLVRVERGRKKAYESMRHVGHIHHCHTCGYRRWQEGFCSPADVCPVCGAGLHYCGPLWLGAYKDDSLCEQMIGELEHMKCSEGAEMMRLLKEELHVPTCYDYHVMARRRSTSPPRMDALLERLRAMGYRASRTHYGGTLLKCDAPSELMCTLP
ncbi:tRNA (guanine(10)-N(2))-dimethyltransferase [Methermicoccus shengliensis]|uniref:tRNA (guanine(26)-N(2))-dimethyltransferase n=1 Tax=Methermicoccus shengliensis TaxID=660064 RepID=A0A832RYG1_9EURY|nr:tRNA (guanine(10)-N(2))-dimethyltransferase [Methermicoccus shengliensis]KUK04714.1 MAG: tRNA (guanine(26)-N(2))-dimethyltransferase [Euryarchaeota archaeon 55_53]KUK30519.1 MAG: tRNA (guanine(26)-N(2))-dimethyltransferase [Methanosarcinales archeaon 56_1174]MDI3487426.1 tRNA (guanine26-N2/guanine27-N2)-dimethyltransferase [Methanosarcinales archaeon]MDN5295245.1 tRNA (guanine26-N2/guanine27-N2)-dimethyltransferase [Methanosarcinales archaeon]HIH69666.1 tRNA (guanine(10)-N(2))-dimethyltrans